MRLSLVTISAMVVAMAAASAVAGSELDTALANGGSRLNSDQIADLIVGKRVTAKAGEKTFEFYYDPANVLSGTLQGGGWSGEGRYAITDGDHVCVSMAQDEGRYRCLTVVRSGDAVHKYNMDGQMTFELLTIETASGL